MAGRPRELSESERKRRRISYQKTRRTQTIYIGEVINDWKELKAELAISTDLEMAKSLIQSYKNSQRSTRKKRKTHVVTSTPWTQKDRESGSEASELSSLSSVKACSIPAMSGVEALSESSNGEKKQIHMYSRYFSKAANDWRYKFVKEKKTYSYIPSLMLQILEAYCQDHKERPLSKKRVYELDDPRRIAPTIAPKEPPPTKELVEKRMTRLKSSWPKPSKLKESCSDDSDDQPKASTSKSKEFCSDDSDDQQ